MRIDFIPLNLSAKSSLVFDTSLRAQLTYSDPNKKTEEANSMYEPEAQGICRNLHPLILG